MMREKNKLGAPAFSPVRIPLRAMCLRWPLHIDRGPVLGVMLPDGRFLVFERGIVGSFSSERQLLKHHIGAHLHWLPDADATLNHVEMDA